MANSSFRILVKVISDADREIYDTVNYVFISSSICLFGIMANVMNIVVFYKQGFTNTMNISFFGLAISDLCGLLMQLYCVVFFNPLFTKSGAPVVGQELIVMISGFPRACFGKTTAWITVYVTAERCLSIMVPLKVKLIITPRRTAIILIFIYTLTAMAFVPEYATSYLGWKFKPDRNRTVLGVLFTENRSCVEGLTYILNSFLGSTSFIAVIVVTVVLVFQLKQKSKWRLDSSSDKTKLEAISNRERKTITMVALIATVLIVCNTPGAAVSMTTFFDPYFSIDGVNVNTYFVSWSFVYIFDAINSSINIFLYYKMSSKYRETFKQVFASWCYGRRSIVE